MRDEILNTLLKLSDRQFDPFIVKMFLTSEDAFERLAADLRDPVDTEENVAAWEERLHAHVAR